MREAGRTEIGVAAAFAFSGVALGALGAHALEEMLAARETAAVWQTAVLYHLVHALALFALGVWKSAAGASRARSATAWLWGAGIILFSGSLYLRALGAPPLLGPLTPVGGLFLLAGWIALFFAAWRRQPGAV